MIFQVLTEEQLSPELAALKPQYLYVPLTLMTEKLDLLRPFAEQGTIPVAVLPRVIADNEAAAVYDMLSRMFDQGVNEALVGNLGHAMLAKKAGMKLRGDFGLNTFNALSMEVIRQAGFISATASFELRLSQIRDMIKPLDTELIIYGRIRSWCPTSASSATVLGAATARLRGRWQTAWVLCSRS